MLHRRRHGFLNAALNPDRVRARSHKFQSFAVNCFGEQRGRGGAIAGIIARFARDLANHLRAHIFASVLQFDFFGHHYPVFGHGRGAEFLSNTTLRPLGPSVAFTARLNFCTPRRSA